MAPLKIASYNCKNFNGIHSDLKRLFIQNLFKNCDFVLLQEHWLFDTQFCVFDDVLPGKSVSYVSKSSMNAAVQHTGRPHGGCAILWKTDMQFHVEGIDTMSSRLTACKVSMSGDVNFVIFNVYMPCENRNENLDVLQDVLSEVSVICNSNSFSFVIFAGDFNIDFTRKTAHTSELLNFCQSEGFQCCKDLPCSDVFYTFEAHGNGSRSHIDHVLVSENMVHSVTEHYTVDNIYNASDHTAVVTGFNINCEYFQQCQLNRKPCTAWYKASIHDLSLYKEGLDSELQNIILPTECMNCKVFECQHHAHDIEKYCMDIVNACLRASKALPQTGQKNVKRRLAGWSEYCENAKKVALEWHHIWKRCGKPHTGEVAENMRKYRSQYHKVVKTVKRNNNNIRSERMAKSLAESNSRNFWSEVKAIKGKNCAKLPSNVDNVTGNDKIAQVFANKFENVFNSVGYNSDECKDVLGECHKRSVLLSDVEINDCLMTKDDIKKAVSKLKSGKSDGDIGMFSDHVIHGSPLLFQHLVNMYNCMIIHGISPQIMLVGTSVPIPKNRKVNKSDNFRGICLQNVLCKIMDILLLQKELVKLRTSELQFGFKDKHSTTLANAVVNETIEYYVNNGGEVFMLALDASKAFDRVNFVKLFEILLQRKLNPLYIRLLVNMYIKQKIRVKYNDSFSEYFGITNGVKQGGVLSPVLFTCYIDGMLNDVKNSSYGCYVGNVFSGCVAYADDVVLLAPSVTALRVMIKKVEQFAKINDISFNGKKSKILYFSKDKDCQPIRIAVNGDSVEQVCNVNYLGHSICIDRNDSLVECIVRDFNVKVNSVIANFSGISSIVKHSLYEKYCTSLYGSNFLDFGNEVAIGTLCRQWRKAMRRIMCLPGKAHSRLLPHIVNTPPINVILMQRFIKFFQSGLKSRNCTVKHIFENAVGSKSRLGRNFKYILVTHCNTKPSAVFDENNLCKLVLKSWLDGCSDEDIRISCQIRELVEERDSLFKNNLSLQQIKDVIEFLCIA